MLEEDRPLSGAERAVARCALNSLPPAARESAFGGAACADAEADLAELVARCVRGEGARAAACLRETLQWRKEHGVDTLLERELPGSAAYHTAWPGSVHGPDASGHVIWLERLRDVNYAALAAMPPAALLAHRTQVLEAVQRRKRELAPAGRVMRQHICVIDCADCDVGMLLNGGTRRVLRAVTEVSNAYYSATLLRCYLVNVHVAGRLAWAALRSLVHPATADKVRLCGNTAELLTCMAADGVAASALPRSLGGTGGPGVAVRDLIRKARLEHAAAAQQPRVFLRDDSCGDMQPAASKQWEPPQASSPAPPSTPPCRSDTSDAQTRGRGTSRRRLSRASSAAAGGARREASAQRSRSRRVDAALQPLGAAPRKC